MTGIAREGDTGIGICPYHTSPLAYVTTFTAGSANVLCNALSVVMIGTIGISSCGHPTIAQTGSGTVLANGIGVHRGGDTGANYGTYTVVSQSADTISG